MASNRSSSSKRTPASLRSKTVRERTDAAATPEAEIPGVPTQYQSLVFGALILVSLIVFFAPVIFSGGLFGASDFVSWESFGPYLDRMDSRGEAPLWMPYIFSGLPGIGAYLVTGDRWWDLSMKIIYSAEHIFGFLNYPVMRVVMHYFIFGLGMYLLMRIKKASRSTAFFVALAAMFSTWIIIYIMIGHNTKIMVLMTFPYIFLCLEKLIDRFSVLYAGLLILAIHVMWEATHLQTAFYGAAAIGIYLAFELIASLVSKDTTGPKVQNVLAACGVLVIAAGFTYGMGMDRAAEVSNYVPYSTRGAAPLVPDPNDEQTEGGGHGWEYATAWSYSPGEMFTFVVPAYFGFGKLEYSGPETGGQTQMVHTYWGQMSFTDAAHYMGIAVLILGLFGAWMNRKRRFIQALLVIGAFGLILSFGDNLAVLYRLFYDYFPSFNKFRAPSQSLVLLEFVFPILAGFGIESLIALKRAGSNPQAEKTILYSAIGFGVFFLIGLAGGAVLREGYIQSIAESGKQIAEVATGQLGDFVYSTMITDWIISGLFGVGTLLLMYFYLQGRITPTVLKLSLLGILIVDLWRIDYRAMDYQPGETIEAAFAETDIDRFLAQDTSLYRILDISEQNVNAPAHDFQQQIIGYHAAKLRNYQDLMDVAGNGQLPTSPTAWNMLNTKYIVAQGPISEDMTNEVFRSEQKQAAVYLNEDYLPRAWFVNRVEVAEPLATLEKIRDQAFDPRDVAFVTEELDAEISPVGYTSAVPPAPDDTTTGADTTTPAAPTGANPGNGSVTVTEFEPLHIGMQVNAPGPGNNFLVISEIHYPPGWEATIDGQPAEIIQTNYVLRGLVVPAGEHTIELNYVSPGFNTGKWLSLALNLVMFGIIGAGVWMERNRKPDPDPAHDGPTVAEDNV